MKIKSIISATMFMLVSLRLSAHPGHPGPADHGDGAHLLLGLGIALTLMALGGFVGGYVLYKRHRKTGVKISTRANKKEPHG